jgi:hypothetical protein
MLGDAVCVFHILILIIRPCKLLSIPFMHDARYLWIGSFDKVRVVLHLGVFRQHQTVKLPHQPAQLGFNMRHGRRRPAVYKP